MSGSLHKSTQTEEITNVERKIEDAWRNLSLNEIKKEKQKTLKTIGKVALKTAVISGAILGGMAIAVPALGFGAAGVTAGSLAATYQSAALGGTIASGSIFATLQSIGAAGLAASTQVGVIGASAAAAAASEKLKKNKKEQREKEKKEHKTNDKMSKKNAVWENNTNDDSTYTMGKKHASTQTI